MLLSNAFIIPSPFLYLQLAIGSDPVPFISGENENATDAVHRNRTLFKELFALIEQRGKLENFEQDAIVITMTAIMDAIIENACSFVSTKTHYMHTRTFA